MSGRKFQTAILYNIDSQISRGDPQDLAAVQFTVAATQHMYDALSSLGYPMLKVAVHESLEELEDTLDSFSPKDTFLFNNCDGFHGDNKAAVEVIRLIEKLGFKHTGAAAESIALCIDKGRAKERLMQCGVPTPSYQVFEQPEGDCNLRFPVIVKPSVEDASMGIDLASVVSNTQDLFHRIAYVIKEYEQPAIVEEFITGRELAVAMWGNEELESLPIAEDDFSFIANPLERLLTFESKWDPESAYYQNIPSCIPAVLTHKDEKIIRQAAHDSFRAMGLRDVGRVDIRFENGIPYVIDINELPDLSPEGGYWLSAQAAGIEYPHMIERVLQFALKREGWME